MVLVTLSFAVLDGCSRADDDNAGPAPSPTWQAYSVQSSVAAAQAAQDRQSRGVGPTPDDNAAAARGPMAMGGDNPGMGAPADAAPGGMSAMGPNGGAGGMPGTGGPPSSGSGAAGGESPPMNMGAPTGMARMLGKPPMAGASTAAGSLPPAMGAPHIYQLGADTLFLDQASAIGLTREQQKSLTALKERAAVANATTQRKIDQSEQDLWVLSSSEAPDLAKIEAKVGEIARLGGQQRMDFIRTIGEAVGDLSDAQRRAVASQEGPTPPGAMPPAPNASAMSMAGGAPSTSSSMGMGSTSRMPPGMGPSGGMPPPGKGMGGPKKMPMSMAPKEGMPPPGAGMAGMPDGGAPGGMGHM